jgi:hypothetical protein
MKYALLLYATPEDRRDEPPTGKDVFKDWVEYTRALKDAGAVLGAERLHAVDTATTVRRRGGERVLTDGPFMETKEHLLGLYLIDVPDLDTALEWAARTPFIEYATVEVRPVMEDRPFHAVLDE